MVYNIGQPRSVYDIDTALQAYWNSRTFRENQAAYHEILLFGGNDGWGSNTFGEKIAKLLRKLAIFFEGKG
jgi:hypothetical protein